MDTSNLKNIVILKELPSNIVEEAIVVLKENRKIEKLELIDRKGKTEQLDKNTSGENNKKSKDYIIKEAQMLIAEYISKIENKNKKENQSILTLNKKCKKLKLINYILTASFIISIMINLIS